jgi:hypothetical protein
MTSAVNSIFYVSESLTGRRWHCFTVIAAQVGHLPDQDQCNLPKSDQQSFRPLSAPQHTLRRYYKPTASVHSLIALLTLTQICSRKPIGISRTDALCEWFYLCAIRA